MPPRSPRSCDRPATPPRPSLSDEISRIEAEVARQIAAAGTDPVRVEALRVRMLGRKGEVSALLRRLGQVPADERPAYGQAVNALKTRVEEALAAAAAVARAAEERMRLERERVDVTLPPRPFWSGSLHPVTGTRRELERIFRDMGFRVESGPEVEDEFHNFEALNLPPDHPARDETDTFYLTNGLLLRTHTSPVQIRTMRRVAPPIQMICPGRVYRRDLDATHLPMFHQLEALVVGPRVTLADLKGTLETVWRLFFGEDVRMRLRPGYFPFVEPGCEYDISCRLCRGAGCRVCKGSGWIELGGAGMVHPAVFEAVGIEPQRYSGFAFGLGIDRIAMMRYGIEDLRSLMEGDVRFLGQFPHAG
jgi:phenylalanyl-tRNA synthetase alpha chain